MISIWACKRDAAGLARLLRAGELTAIRVPSAAEEAVRDLCRALASYRGIADLSALTLATEVVDWRRLAPDAGPLAPRSPVVVSL